MNRSKKIVPSGIGAIILTALLMVLVPAGAEAASSETTTLKRGAEALNHLPARLQGKPLSDPAVERYVAKRVYRQKGATAHSAALPGIARKAFIFALRHGGDSLGNFLGKASPSAGDLIRKYSGKTADALDAVDSLAEIPLTAFLIKTGVPPNDAAQMARAIVLILG